MGKHYVHGGKAGDLLLQLTVIATHREGHLRLWPNPHVGTSPWGIEFARTMFPLLEIQPYIQSVSYTDQPPQQDEVNMDIFRYGWLGHLNLSDMLHEKLQIPYWSRTQPWLHVPDPLKISRVIFARCPRYHNARMPWRQIMAKYKKYQPTFVGHADEHQDLQRIVGPLAYYPTRDYLTLARVIAGCDLFVSNQSSPHAIAEGLKKRKLLEVAIHDNNCHWERSDATYVRDGGEELPDLDGPAWHTPSPSKQK